LLKKEIKFKIFAIDKSPDALKVAEENIKKNEIQSNYIKLAEKNLLEINEFKSNIDYIVSNPPYVSLTEYNNLQEEIKNYEPADAITDFKDGFVYIDKIIELGLRCSFSNKIFIEIGNNQAGRLSELLKQKEIKEFKFFKDFQGIKRILYIYNESNNSKS
jgi:release factor glutamine methyltransferase